MSDDEVTEEVAEEAVVEKAKPKKAKAFKAPKSVVEETTQVFYGVDPMYQNTSVVKAAKRAEPAEPSGPSKPARNPLQRRIDEAAK